MGQGVFSCGKKMHWLLVILITSGADKGKTASLRSID
jgi:hypothetical protein